MADVITEIYHNGLTDGIDNKHSSLKNLMSEFTNLNIERLNQLSLIQNDLLFKDIGNDILVKCENKNQIIKAISKYGYEKIDKNKYMFAENNYAGVMKEVKYIENYRENFIEKIKIKDKEFKYFFEKGFLILFNETSQKAEYFYNLSHVNIKDIKIDSKLFVYILYNYKNKQYLTKTHLGKQFSQYNIKDQNFESKELLFNIVINSDLENQLKEILFFDNNDFYFLGDKIQKISLYKKYFFVDNNFVYFNHHGEMKNYKEYFIEEIQTNYSNIYNYLNFLGLNDFQIKNRKISTYEMRTFLDVVINKFDNTFNGGTNYFIIKNHYDNINDENKKIFKIKPDYHISYRDNVFAINGNFNYKMEKGTFKIIIENNKISLFKKNNHIFTFVDSVIINNKDEFYFYQLKFQNLNYNLPDFYEFTIKTYDEYPFKQEVISKEFSKLFNSKKNIDYFVKNEKSKNLEDVFFINNSIMFNNVFDWNKKEFIYNSLKSKIKANEGFDLNNIKNFYIDSEYEIKSNKVFPRNNSTIVYTTIKSFDYELINKNGFISDFWIKNQGKTLYFKKNKNQIDIIDNFNEADYSLKLPLISEYLNIDKIQNVDILMNDEMQYSLDNSEDLLATTKFQDVPLFYKVFIPTKDKTVNIFDQEDNYITKYYIENENEGINIYFNINPNHKYYYVLDEQKIYFEPIKAFENNIEYYDIEHTGYINFEKIKKLSMLAFNTNLKNLKEDFECKLFIYNSFNSTMKRINLNKDSINKYFEINFLSDKIYIELKDGYDYKDFYLTESFISSITEENKIIYFKKDYNDICYISKASPKEIHFEKYYSKIQLNKKYLLDKNSLIEDENGNIELKPVLDNSIFINVLNKKTEFKKDVFKTFSTSKKDEFYLKNFKSVGIEHEFLDIKNSETIKSYNKQIKII